MEVITRTQFSHFYAVRWPKWRPGISRLEMAENEVVTGRWNPRVKSHCDRHHKRKIEIHLFLCMNNRQLSQYYSWLSTNRQVDMMGQLPQKYIGSGSPHLKVYRSEISVAVIRGLSQEEKTWQKGTHWLL